MLEISSFPDAGVLEKERLVIKALSQIDIGSYILLVSNVSETKSPTSGRKTAYWFPDGEINSGDLVVLYTKKGKSSKKDIGEGRTAHFYYLGLDNPLWGTSNRTAVILRVAEWTHQIS